MANRDIKELYYITHVENVPSILKMGILSHKRVTEEHIDYKLIYDEQIISRRRDIKTQDGRSLWEFANLYFQPRNPMLYRVVSEKPPEDIAILGINPTILNDKSILISTGNAAHNLSEILPAHEGRKKIPEIRRATNKEWWTEENGLKRKIMAECLVPVSVSPDMITAIFVASHEAAEKIKNLVQNSNIAIIPEPKMFFKPLKKISLTDSLSLIEGDLFFSRMQTLTISVNCVGVMGKGLASRAKYQFPDVYVYYQDLCKEKILKMGKPHLYKREISFDHNLADEPLPLSNNNNATWFLLFPTKRHWRENSDINGIEQGLKWLQANYIKEDMKSLAIPALGCGLGRLEWRDVGPLMCRILSALNIPVWLYLPAEKQVHEELLTRDFLLG